MFLLLAHGKVMEEEIMIDLAVQTIYLLGYSDGNALCILEWMKLIVFVQGLMKRNVCHL